jgi:CRISPR-associated protein Cas2
MRMVISYDITSPKTRRRASNVLEGYAERVQRSVYEGVLPSPQSRRLREKLARLPLGPEDSIRYYTLCDACSGRLAVEGKGPLVRAPAHFIV